MNSRTAMRAKIGLVVLGAAAAGAAFGQAGRTVMFKDDVVSRDIRVINGRPYVPLADMAKALGGFAVKTASGWQIKTKDQTTASTTTSDTGATGGTMNGNPVAGASGSIGDSLSDGKWRFQVVNYQDVDSYTLQRDGGVDVRKLQRNADVQGKTIQAKPDYSLIVVNCQVKNGQKQAQAFGSGYGRNTALIDTKGVSYAPIGWDQDGGMQATKPLPVGATDDIAAIFLVPFGTQVASATFTLGNVSDPAPHDVHVSLQVAQ